MREEIATRFGEVFDRLYALIAHTMQYSVVGPALLLMVFYILFTSKSRADDPKIVCPARPEERREEVSEPTMPTIKDVKRVQF